MNSPALAGGKKAVAPAGIDGQRRPEDMFISGGILCNHPFHAPIFLDCTFYPDVVPHIGAELPGVLQQHGIELRAGDLPGQGHFVVEVIKKIEWLGHFAADAGKLHTVFFGEAGLLELIDHPDALQGVVAVGNQRLADMIAGKRIFFQHQHLAPVLGQDRSSGGTGRAASDDDGIIIHAVPHSFFETKYSQLTMPQPLQFAPSS